MSKIALLLCAKPTTNYVGHTVYVPSGLWRVVTENLIDTKLSILITLHGSDVESIQYIDEFILGPAHVNIKVIEIGQESYINVFLEQIRNAA